MKNYMEFRSQEITNPILLFTFNVILVSHFLPFINILKFWNLYIIFQKINKTVNTETV